MKIVFLSRYQKTLNRGAETFIKELSSRLSSDLEIEIFSGQEADSLSKIIAGRFDIVVPINGRFQALKASVGRLWGSYKTLITGHSGIGRDDIWNLAISKPDVFVCLTDYQLEWAKKFAWGSKLVKISNGVDLEKFRPEGERYKFNLIGPIVLSVGALVWYKHHERTIEAVSKLKNVSLVIVGEGEQKEYLEKLGHQKLGQKFKLLKADYDELPKIYRACDLFVLPSWGREAFGIVYLEAMASNLAIVAPDDPPRREIIGKGGILTNTANSDNYSQAIQNALDLNWANVPRKQAEKFSWDEISKSYEKVFKDLGNK